MRLLQICSARSIGGGERHIADLSNELTKRGHDVFVAVRPGSPMVDELSALPSQNIATFPLRNALDIKSAVNTAKFVRDEKIELINAHLARDYTVAAFAASMNRVPLVVTRHVLFPMNRLHRFFLPEPEFVIAPSNAVAENLRREGIFPAEKIVTIRYGMDVERFADVRPIDHDGLRVGTIGNLDPVKGFDVFVRAAGIVVAEMPEIKFEIVGVDRSRDGHNEKDLRKLISELGLDRAVELKGWSADVREPLAHLDLFVSSSRSESFGFVIAEAMLAGVPVIATETEGAKEIISDPSLGRLVPIASPGSLAEAILDLLRDRGKRQEFASLGRVHVEKNFSLQRMVDETEALYRRVLLNMP